MKDIFIAIKHLFGIHNYIVETYGVGQKIRWDGVFKCSLCNSRVSSCDNN